jgi:hypothetical protein
MYNKELINLFLSHIWSRGKIIVYGVCLRHSHKLKLLSPGGTFRCGGTGITKSIEVVRVNSIKMDRNEIGYDYMNWINPAQDLKQWRAVMNTVLTSDYDILGL